MTLGKVAIDGTKVQADANRHWSMTYGQMVEEERVEAEVERLTAVAEARNRAEVRDDELPEELQRQKGRLATLRQAKERLEEREAHLLALQDQQAVRTSGSDLGPEDGEGLRPEG